MNFHPFLVSGDLSKVGISCCITGPGTLRKTMAHDWDWSSQNASFDVRSIEISCADFAAKTFVSCGRT